MRRSVLGGASDMRRPHIRRHTTGAPMRTIDHEPPRQNINFRIDQATIRHLERVRRRIGIGDAEINRTQVILCALRRGLLEIDRDLDASRQPAGKA